MPVARSCSVPNYTLGDSRSPLRAMADVGRHLVGGQNPRVTHWYTDKAHFESLLDQLSKKPGVHALHVSAGDTPRVTPHKARWG